MKNPSKIGVQEQVLGIDVHLNARSFVAQNLS